MSSAAIGGASTAARVVRLDSGRVASGTGAISPSALQAFLEHPTQEGLRGILDASFGQLEGSTYHLRPFVFSAEQNQPFLYAQGTIETRNVATQRKDWRETLAWDFAAGAPATVSATRQDMRDEQLVVLAVEAARGQDRGHAVLVLRPVDGGHVVQHVELKRGAQCARVAFPAVLQRFKHEDGWTTRAVYRNAVHEPDRAVDAQEISATVSALARLSSGASAAAAQVASAESSWLARLLAGAEPGKLDDVVALTRKNAPV